MATFDNNGYRDPIRLNERVGATLDKGGNLSYRQDLADARPETTIVQYNSITGHNIPQVFWDFLNLQGRYMEGGVVRSGTVVDWTFAMGLPITDAYWVRAQVGPVEKDVLVQLFERRVLTYVPDNPPGYQVEMGNVGQHYFQWRYPHLGMPWAAPDPELPLLYTSDILTPDHWELYLQTAGGYVQLTRTNAESVGFSYRRSYEPSLTRVLIDSRRGDGQHRQLYELDLPPVYSRYDRSPTERRVAETDSAPVPATGVDSGLTPGLANDYNPSVSPDGAKIAFVSDRYGTPQLYLMRLDGGMPARLTGDDCVSQVPAWSPDGRTLYWKRQCPGARFQIMRGDVSYSDDATYSVFAQLVNVRELTGQNTDNRFPRVSPSGQKIVFTSYRDGNAEIYLMNVDGSSQTRLTDNSAEDEAATWNSSGTALAFASNRDGDYEIYIMNVDGSNVRRYTDNTAQDRWPMWAQ